MVNLKKVSKQVYLLFYLSIRYLFIYLLVKYKQSIALGGSFDAFRKNSADFMLAKR